MGGASGLHVPIAALAAAICLGGHLFGVTPVESRTALGPREVVEAVPSRRLMKLVDVLLDDVDQDRRHGSRPARHRVGLASMSHGPEMRSAAAPTGLRAIQRWPSESLFGRKSIKRNGSQQVNESIDEMVLEWPRHKRLAVAAEQVATPGAQGPASDQHKFVYLVSPLSQLVHLIEAERSAQGYRSLLPLSLSYRTALQKVAPSGAEVPAVEMDYPLDDVCQTRREQVHLTRDETDPISGSLLRRCSGQVELNTCAGTCSGGVQPSIKSPSGFVKKCACCNEATFRRLQVRLTDCTPVALDIGQQLAQANFMDAEVEEPIDCACRRCEGLA